MKPPHQRFYGTPPPPIKQQRTTKKKILKTKNKQTTIVKKWSLNASFASVLEGEPGPPPLFFYFGNSLTHPNRRDWSTSPYGSGLTCSFWIRDGQCSMYYYGYDLICTPEGISFFGAGGLSPHQREESFPNLNQMYPPNSALRAPTHTHPVDFWLTFGPATESYM